MQVTLQIACALIRQSLKADTAMHCILGYPCNVFPDQTAADAALYRTCRRRTCIICTGRGCILNIFRGFVFNTRRFVHNVVPALQMCDDIGRSMEPHASIAQLAEHYVLGHLLTEIPNVAGTFTLFFAYWRICSPLHVFWNKFCLQMTIWYESMIIKMDSTITITYHFIYFLRMHASQMFCYIGSIAATEIQNLLAEMAKCSLIIEFGAEVPDNTAIWSTLFHGVLVVLQGWSRSLHYLYRREIVI